MCWRAFKAEKKIAQKDFNVYKVLMRNVENSLLVSPFRYFPYCLGKEYKAEIHVEEAIFHYEKDTIDEGLHCYSEECMVKEFCKSIAVGNHYGALLECYTGEFYRLGTSPVVVKCTIPKGTAYYENGNGEIVTEKYILNKVVHAPTDLDKFKNLEERYE